MVIYSLFLWLSLLLLLPPLLHIIGKKKHERAKPNFPPGPSKLPIIGNLHQLGGLPHRSLYQLSRKHGSLMYLQLGRIPTIVISSASLAREVLKTYDLEFCSRPPLMTWKKLSYDFSDVAFAPYGEYWRDMRKIFVLELLSTRRVMSFRSIREEEVAEMISWIHRSSSDPINLSEILLSLANNIVCRVAFGKKYQGGCEKSRFYEVLEESQALLAGFAATDYFPSMGWIDVLTGLHRRLKKNFLELDSFYEQVIEEHLDPKRQKEDEEDIIDVLLHIPMDPFGKSHLTRDQIKGILMNILIAGTDTNTATMVWALTELAKNPRVMKKANEEIRRFVGNKRKVEESDLHQFQYLKSVIKETLRLHSPSPLLVPRETTKHCKIDGYDIYPKTRVYVNAWAIGRDPETWKNPEEFMPERFEDGSIDFRGQSFEFIPFGAGRRGCPAINFGIALVELALANLLYHFEWELPKGMKEEDIKMNEAPGLTVHKKSALHLVASSYNC